MASEKIGMVMKWVLSISIADIHCRKCLMVGVTQPLQKALALDSKSNAAPVRVGIDAYVRS